MPLTPMDKHMMGALEDGQDINDQEFGNTLFEIQLNQQLYGMPCGAHLQTRR